MAKGLMNDSFKYIEELIGRLDRLEDEVKTLRKENSKLKNIEKQFVELVKENAVLKEKIVILENKNALLEKENSLLKNEVDRLKKQINNDSNNSSKPPSSDIKKNIPNNRNKSKNNIGGQIGHKGYCLSKKYVEDNVKNSSFAHEVVNIGNVGSGKYLSKYLLDISVSVKAIEYRFYKNIDGKFNIPKEFKHDVQYGNELKTLISVLNSEGVVAIDRLNDLITNLTHNKINMSNGTIVNIIKTLSNKSSNIIEDIQTKVLNSNLMYTDATTSRCENRNMCVRNYSTDKYTLLKATKGKGKKYIKETNILPIYTGNLVHDHETVMYNYGNKHAECNVHISRYLKGRHDETKNSWSNDMKHFLCCLNEHKKQLQSINIENIDKEKLTNYSYRYDEILNNGFEQNKLVSSKVYKKEELKLLNRLKKYKDNHLQFIFDFCMPFSNNLSERDLRHVKTKQKISGSFNSIQGLQNYLDIKSIIGTCKKQGLDYYNIIRNIFENEPVTI